MVDLFPKDFLERQTFLDLKLATLSCSCCLRCVTFALSSDLEQPQLLIELLFDLRQLVKEESFLSRAVFSFFLSLLVVFLLEIRLVKIGHCEGVGVSLEICSLGLSTSRHMLLILLLVISAGVFLFLNNTKRTAELEQEQRAGEQKVQVAEQDRDALQKQIEEKR